MVNDGKITNNGVNLMLERAYATSTSKARVSEFRVGVGTTTPSIADTEMENPVPIDTSTVETIDDCEIADWTEGSAGLPETLNSTTFKEGTKALNLPKDGSNILATWTKTVTSYDGTSKNLFMWAYIKDAAALAKLATTACMVIRYGSDGSNYYYLSKNKADLAVGWNLLTSSISVMSITGTPVITALDYAQIRITTTNAADTFTVDEIVMDYWHLASADDFPEVVSDISFDTSNKQVIFTGFINSIQANGYLLTEVGLSNTDSPVVLDSRDTHTGISKSDTDEITYILTHEINNT